MEILNAAIFDIHAPELILGSQGLTSGSECSSEASWADYDHMGDRELFPSLLDDTSLISSIHGDDTSVELGDVDEDPLLNNCFLSSNLDTTPPLDTHSEPEIPLGMFDLTCADLADFNDLDLGDSTVSSITPYANDLLMSKTSPSHTCYETSSIPHSLSSPAHNYLTSSPNCMMTSPSRTMSSPNRSYSTTTSPRHNHSSNPGLSQHVASSPLYSRHVLSSPVRNEHVMSSSLHCQRMISSPSRARSNPDVSYCGISSPTHRSNHTTNAAAHAWLNRSPSPTHSIRSTVTTSSLYNDSSSISNAQSRCTSPTSDSDKAPTSARNRGKRKQRTTSSRNAIVSIEQWEAHRKTNKRSRQTSNGDGQYRACAKHKSISSSDNNLSNTERRKLVADLSHVITEEMDIRQQIDIINIIQPDKHTHNFVIDLNLLTDEKLTRIKHIIDTCRQQNKARHTTPPAAAAPAQHKRGRGKGRGHAAQEGRGHAASVKRTSSNPASSSCGLSNRVPVGGGHHPLQPHGRRSHTITPSSSVSSLATCTSGYASDDTGTAQQVQQHHAENNTPHDSQQQSKITTAIQQQPKLTKRERQAKAKQERQQMQKHARQQRKEEQSGLFVNEEIVILTSKRHPSSSATTSVSQVTDDNHLLSYVIDSGSDIEVDI